MNSNTTKILWVSDIHIKVDEFKYYNIESYFDKMVNYVEDEYPTLDYIIISGDIAFSGESEEYNLFREHFIEKIKMKYKNIIILSIPGNHDIMWNQLSPTDENFFTNNYNTRNKFISEQNEISFENYVNFFKNNILPTFNSKENIEHSFKNEKECMTHGYVIDINNKICFILINSAWLSFGQGLVNAFISNKEIFKYDKSIKDNLKTILSNVTNFPEFGSQMIGSKFIENLKLLSNVFDNYNDHTVITVMHHPQNWLHYEELYGKTENIHNKKPLNQLKEHSHIFLTGHEHVPHFANKITDNDPIHIKGGCFIDDYSTPFDEQENNRFSILEVIRNEGASFVKNIDFNIKIETENSGDKKTIIECLKQSESLIYLKKKIYYPKDNDSRKKENFFKAIRKIKDLLCVKKYEDIILYDIDDKNGCISVVDYSEFVKKNNKEIFHNFISENLLYKKIDITVYLTDDEFRYKEKISKENNIEEKIQIINETFDKYKIKKEDLFNKYKHSILKEFFDNDITDFNKISIKFHLEKRVKIF